MRTAFGIVEAETLVTIEEQGEKSNQNDVRLHRGGILILSGLIGFHTRFLEHIPLISHYVIHHKEK